MSIESFFKAIMTNIGVKVMSVLFAVFLWFHVTAQQEETQTFRVPLTLSGIPDSLTIVHDVPEFVEIVVKGARSRLIKLRLFGGVEASVDLSMVKRGRVNVPLSAAVLNLSDELDPREVIVERPKALSLNFERVVTKSVPVKLAFRGEIPDDVIITGKPVIIPGYVKVTGAASLISGTTVISTEEIDIRNRRGKMTREVELHVESGDVKVDPKKVLVEMEISKRAVRTLANIPPVILQDDESVITSYSPLAVSLTIEGSEELINSIVSDDVSIILNVTAREPGTYRINPEIILPNGIERYWLDIDSFEITIARREREGAQGRGE